MLVKTIDALRAFKAGDDTLIREVLHPDREDLSLNYSLAHAQLEPGQASLPHRLRDSSEVYIILEGEGRVFIDGESDMVNSGQVVFIPSGAEQYIEATGAGPLRFLCIVSPPWRAENEVVY